MVSMFSACFRRVFGGSRKHPENMPKTCRKHAENMFSVPKTCFRCRKHCFRNRKHVFGAENMFSACFRDVFGMFSGCFRGLPKTSRKHAENIETMPNTCRKHSQPHFTKTLPNCTSAFSTTAAHSGRHRLHPPNSDKSQTAATPARLIMPIRRYVY